LPFTERDRMAPKSPFVHVKVKCPVCEQESAFRYLRRRIYKIAAIDRDNFPVRYEWEEPAFAHIVPHRYYYWVCPACFFVDTEQGFRGEAEKSKKFSLLAEKLQAARKEGNPVGRVLSGHVKGGVELETATDACLAHIAGIWQHELLTENMRDATRLSRFCLRLSWLYREAKKDNTALLSPEVVEEFQSVWPDFPADRRGAIRQAKHYYNIMLDRDVTEGDHKRKLTILFLLAEFDMILGNLNDAVAMTNTIFSYAVRERNKTNELFQNGRAMNNKTYDMLKDRVRFLENCVEEVKQFKERAFLIILKLEKPKADALVLSKGEIGREGMGNLLRRQGFHEITIRTVLEGMA